MPSPPTYAGLWQAVLVWDYSDQRRAQSTTWFIAPPNPSRAQVFDAALHIGDGWFGTDGFFWQNQLPAGVTPAVIMRPWFDWGQPVLATSSDWEGTRDGPFCPNTSCAVVEIELDRTTSLVLPRGRRTAGRVHLPFVDVQQIQGATSNLVSNDALTAWRESLPGLLAQLQFFTDSAGGSWLWVVPVSVAEPVGRRQWLPIPIAGVTVRPTIGNIARRGTTLGLVT